MYNITGKKYSSKQKKGIGGFLGTALGAGAGAFLGNPMLGAKLGGMAGGAIEGAVSNPKEAEAPSSMVSPSYGYAGGGFIPEYSLAFGGKTEYAKGGNWGEKGYDRGKKPRKSKKKNNLVAYGGNIMSEVHKAKGGKIKPIGQDAKKIEGKSHEQGGVELNKDTEVEGGETMDNVNGQGYVFSKRLKVPGTYKTFAEVHEEMVKNNSHPQNIEQLAKIQERVAGRDDSVGPAEKKYAKTSKKTYAN